MKDTFAALRVARAAIITVATINNLPDVKTLYTFVGFPTSIFLLLLVTILTNTILLTRMS